MGDERIAGGEDGQQQTDDNEDATVPDPVGDRSGKGCRPRRRERQEPMEETGDSCGAPNRHDVVRRGRQQLEHRHEHGEAVPEHDEEPGGEQAV